MILMQGEYKFPIWLVIQIRWNGWKWSYEGTSKRATRL